MRIGKFLIVVIALSALAGCAKSYYMPRESEPHATLVFEEGKGSYERPTMLKLNGAQRVGARRRWRIGVGTMRLELGETIEGGLTTPGPSFTCELSFEAEAGRQYLVSMRWEDDHFLYAVTADNGTQVAECKAQETCDWQYRICSAAPVPGGQGTGEGAIVIRNDAPVYKKADSTGGTWKLKRGDAVVADSGKYNKSATYQFYEKSSRVRILFIDAGELRGGWMKLDDLAKLTYSFCRFDHYGTIFNPPGFPFTTGKKMNWNVCFQEARDAKLKELRAKWEKE